MTGPIAWLGRIAVAAAAAGVLTACGGAPSGPSPGPQAPAPPSAPSLTAPVHQSPAVDAQLTSLQPELTVGNSTSSQSGAKSYQFQVSSTADFGAIAADAQNIAEGATSTSWTLVPPLLPNTIYWWRARVTQGSTIGPWSTPTRFKSKIEGYNLPGELFDPLTNGVTVGSPTGVTFEDQGVRLNSLGSRVRYPLLRTISEGEFSLQATQLDNSSEGENTKLFSMMQGSADIATNPFRATAEKRASGEVSFRLIAGDLDNFATAGLGERRILQFNPRTTYFWKFTWGSRTARLVITENDEQGRVLFNLAKSYGGTYLPNPHIAHLGAPIPRGGLADASTPGGVIRNVWLSSKPRPAGLGALTPQ